MSSCQSAKKLDWFPWDKKGKKIDFCTRTKRLFHFASSCFGEKGNENLYTLYASRNFFQGKCSTCWMRCYTQIISAWSESLPLSPTFILQSSYDMIKDPRKNVEKCRTTARVYARESVRLSWRLEAASLTSESCHILNNEEWRTPRFRVPLFWYNSASRLLCAQIFVKADSLNYVPRGHWARIES